MPQERRRHFFIYLDEFHTFATLTLATMLSELRKYRVGLVLAHQYLSQLETEVRDAVFGNVGTFISFRVGALEAPVIARELSPKFAADDLISLPNYHVYLRLMIDGQPSKPFSAETVRVEEVPRPRARVLNSSSPLSGLETLAPGALSLPGNRRAKLGLSHASSPKDR